jgi:hypothetical protein
MSARRNNISPDTNTANRDMGGGFGESLLIPLLLIPLLLIPLLLIPLLKSW